MPMVKLTLFPDPVEVPEDEIPALRSQGLVEDGFAETPAKAAKSQPRKDEQ